MADPFFSEIKYLGNRNVDFIEVAVDAGADVSDLVVTIYQADGTVRSSNVLDELTPVTVAGKDVYVIDTTSSSTFNGIALNNGLSLSEGSTVYAFYSFDDRATPLDAVGGPADGLTSTPIGSAGAGESLQSDDGGATYFVQTDPNSGTIPCLTRGTLIETPGGPVRVEDLRAGMHVCTHGGHAAELLAVLHKQISSRDMLRNRKLCPVRIAAGALGAGLPRRDLLVSRQHRMLVNSPIVARMFGVPEVLIAAIRLVGLPGIQHAPGVAPVTYFHLLFHAHQVILAEGAPTESLFLGAEAGRALSDAQRAEIAAIFPELLAQGADLVPNRMIPPSRRQKRLVSRHARNAKPLFVSPREPAPPS